MKILYAIQATGNGHISRAMELMPYLQQYGTVDVFLSGSNSHLQPDLPVTYRSKGVSLFYGNTGGLDYRRMMKEFSIRRIWQEARALPVERYDVVLNDFECITALACKLKKVPSIGFGHQASFRSPLTPRAARRDIAGEMILQHYGAASDYVGLHFASYDDFIVSPVIKQKVLQADPCNKGHITVYLSHYSDEVIVKSLGALAGVRFEVFSKEVTTPVEKNNIRLLPVSNHGFTESMIGAAGVITGAGFETPAEALYLGKKLLCLPIRGQYEQLCNAAALAQCNVKVVDKIDAAFVSQVATWLAQPAVTPLRLMQDTRQIVQMAIDKARALNFRETMQEEPLLTDEDFAVM